MKILYLAKHDQNDSNDDEGAIYRALETLGHDVVRLREVKGHVAYRPVADFLLFHKWDDVASLKKVKIPKVFWYFDLVDWPADPTLKGRCKTRIEWMKRTIPEVDLGFCTDGDWVAKDKTGKLYWLAQGADGRVLGRGKPGCCPTCKAQWIGTKVLFAGSKNGGTARLSHIEELSRIYGDKFFHATKTYGRELADLIANSAIVIAPESPVTSSYWSNRVYVTLGFGGFLLHPYSAGLAAHYHHGIDIVYYKSRGECRDLTEHWLVHPEERWRIQVNAVTRTIAEHTYTHRLKLLVETVKAKLGII